MSDVWYYADTETSVGPLTIVELKKTLRMLPNPNDVLVWCADFTEWKKAGEIAELRTRTPPPVPSSTNNDRTPTWRVRWWWYPVALCFFGSIGNRYGREGMAWISSERAKNRRLRRAQRRELGE